VLEIKEPASDSETAQSSPALKNGFPISPVFGLLPAPQVEPELSIQTINFPPIPSREFGPTVPLKATASSGLPVTFKAVTNDTCEVLRQGDESLAQALRNSLAADPVLCSIVATQTGDTKFAPAAPVERSFTLLKPRDTQVALGLITRIATTTAGRMNLKTAKGTQFGAMLKLASANTVSGKISANVSTPSTCSIIKVTSLNGSAITISLKPLSKGTCNVELSYAGDSKKKLLSSNTSWTAIVN